MPSVHHVVDSERARELRIHEARVANRDYLQSIVNNEAAVCREMSHPDTNPLDSFKKMGNPLSHTLFEQRLLRIRPDLIFKKASVACVIKVAGDVDWASSLLASKVTFKAVHDPRDWKCEREVFYTEGVMPERSLWRWRRRRVPDVQVDPSTGFEHFDAKDFPKFEWTGLKDDRGNPTVIGRNGEYVPGNFVPIDRKASMPGWKEVIEFMGERPDGRGWRTVLIQCISKGIITVEQAEREFGADSTPEWKQHTGKSSRILVRW